MDSYDSDFGKEDDSAAPSYESEQGEDRKVEVRKKIKKVHFHKSLEDLTQRGNVEEEEEGKRYYIHEFFTQEELLKEAVETEVRNKYLISSR